MKISAVVLLVVAIALLFGIARDHKIQSGFSTMAPHAEEAQVRAALGAANRIIASCHAYEVIYSPNCDHVLYYRSSFAPVRSAYWLIFMDAQGHALAKVSQTHP